MRLPDPRVAPFLILCLAVLSSVSCRPAEDVSVEMTVSSMAGDRLARRPPIAFTADDQAGLPVIAVDDTRSYQRIDGFGATFNEAGLLTLNKLEPARQEEVLRALFDPVDGAGFNFMSAPIAACDFASAGPWYTYADTPGDVALEHFSIERDLGPDGLVTFIKRARQHGEFLLQTTADYPPDWMLDEKMNLKPEHYDAYARYLVKYVQAYAAEGITVDALSPFNEPFHVYCRITYPQVRELLKKHIGPRFREAGLTTKLQPPDTNNRTVARDEFPAFMEDAEARQFIHSFPVHGYDWKDEGSEPIGELHARYSDVPLWMTEVCHMKRSTESGRPTPVHEFDDGDWWGRMLVSDLRAGASAWIYWNMILDQTGGPWLISEKHENPDGNTQQPVVIVDTETGNVTYTGLYYYLAHFSKFVPRDSVRIDAEGDIDRVSFAAFRAPAGGKVLQVVNSRNEDVQVAIRFHGASAAVSLPAVSISTLMWP